jgi:hypothetical protein
MINHTTTESLLGSEPWTAYRVRLDLLEATVDDLGLIVWHQLVFDAELGLTASDPGMAEVLAKIYAHQSVGSARHLQNWENLTVPVTVVTPVPIQP